MTPEMQGEALATYIRQKLHDHAASAFRHNDTTKSAIDVRSRSDR